MQLDTQRSELVSPGTLQSASPLQPGADYLLPTSTSPTMSDPRRQLAAATMKSKWQQLKKQQKRQQRQAMEADLDRMQQEQAQLKVKYNNHDQQPPLQKPQQTGPLCCHGDEHRKVAALVAGPQCSRGF